MSALTGFFGCSARGGGYDFKPPPTTTNQNSRDAKAAVLASVGLAPRGQRLEVATRTRVTGPGLAIVAIEDHVTAPALLTGEGGEAAAGVDGGVERLLRYLRLKHLSASGLARVVGGGGVKGEEGGRASWARLGSERCREWMGETRDEALKVEMAAALEAVALCQEGLNRVNPPLVRVWGLAEDDRGSAKYRHRLGLVKTLLHGERMALAAIAEFAMAAVEAAEAEMEGGGKDN